RDGDVRWGWARSERQVATWNSAKRLSSRILGTLSPCGRGWLVASKRATSRVRGSLHPHSFKATTQPVLAFGSAHPSPPGERDSEYAARNAFQRSLLINTEVDLKTATRALLELDPRLVPIVAIAGPPPLRRREGGFSGLASIVVAQQLSTASASAIWGRLTAMLHPLQPAAFLRVRAPRLKPAGPSAPKIHHAPCRA